MQLINADRFIPLALFLLAISFGVALSSTVSAAVLPEDRADILYHSYSGGGVTVDGPSLLVRKAFKEKFSISANYYVDNVSSASIDVQLSASEYTEKRTETSLGLDYLRNKTLLSVSTTQSEENDYEAQSFSVNISQDFFGDLSTLNMGYSRGNDKIFQNGDNSVNEKVNRQHFRLGLSQIITKKLIVSVNYEGISDEGFLNNPYRQVRFIDPLNTNNFRLEREVYPRTRTSDAIALGSMLYLPYRAAVKFKARYYTDDWGIEGSTIQLIYVHPFGEQWVGDIRYRYYQQEAADFYNDLFPHSEFQNFKARDKELSEFSSHSVGVSLAYTLSVKSLAFIEKARVNLSFDHMRFDYDNFRDATVSQNDPTINAGEEPLYQFSANVVRFYISLFY